MKVSVVVPTYNRRASLERCLSSLASQEFAKEHYEVIVVADGCTDGTPKLLRTFKSSFTFRWFVEPNRGAATAQNLGIAVAIGEIVLFLDDDCICDPGLIAAHLDAHAVGGSPVVIGAVLLDPKSPPGTLHDVIEDLEVAEWRRLCSQGARQSDLMLCANSSITREALINCRFDTTYSRMHDVEIGIRLWGKGYRPRFAPKAIVHELYTKSVDAMLRDSYQHGRYDVILTNNYPAYKSMTGVVNMNRGNLAKRWLRKQLALHAEFGDRVLQAVGASAEVFRKVGMFSWLAKRSLSLRAGAAHLKGAIQEAGSWKCLEARFGKRVPVIMYHNVGAPRSGEYPGLTVPAVEFEAQVRFLSRMGYKGIRPSEWLQWRDTEAPLPNRPVILVFDDGYAEICRTAFPVLERYGFGAACMVVTSYVGSSNRWDEAAGMPTLELMNQSDILEWTKRGIEFGGHSCDHSELPLIESARLEREIAQCSGDLAALLGTAPASFAYPYGSVSPRVEGAVRTYFRLAFTASQGVLHLGTNPHRVPRIRFLPGETRFGIWCRLRLGRNPIEVCRGRWLRAVKKIRIREASRKVTPARTAEHNVLVEKAEPK